MTRTVKLQGLELQVPADWQVRRLPLECYSYGPGILISNVRYRFERFPRHMKRGCTTFWDLRRAPRTLIALDLSQVFLPSRTQVSARVPPPLPLTKAPYYSPRDRSPLCTCTTRYAYLRTHGLGYALRTWVAASASQTTAPTSANREVPTPAIATEHGKARALHAATGRGSSQSGRPRGLPVVR